MTLRRFPWKNPRLSDPSYKQYAATDKIQNTEPIYRQETFKGNKTNASGPPPIKTVIKGPWRLLRTLPRETRELIRGMLTVDVEKRFKMEDIWKDSWFESIDYCKYKTWDADRPIGYNLSKGKKDVYHAKNHTHVLVGPSDSPPPSN